MPLVHPWQNLFYTAYVEFCPCGHTYGLKDNTEAYEKWGYGSGTAPSSECPECNEERRARLRRELRLCSEFCDPELNGCENGCHYRLDLNDIPKSPSGFVFLD